MHTHNFSEVNKKVNNQLHFRAGGLQNATCFAYFLAILWGRNEAQPYFEGCVLAEGCGNLPSMAAEGTCRCLPATCRLVGSPVRTQIILKNRPRGYRPEAGIWDMSQLTRKGLNYKEQESAKTELYFKHVISHHVALLRKLLELGGGRAYSLSESWCVSRRLWQGRNRKGKGLQCL